MQIADQAQVAKAGRDNQSKARDLNAAAPWHDERREYGKAATERRSIKGAFGSTAVRMPNGSVQPARLLRLKQVMDLVPLSKSTIYALIAKGEFPQQVSLGGGIVAWREWEILRWIAERPAA